MRAAERVRKGFWRIGLVGAVAGAAASVVLAVLAAHAWFFTRKVSVYYNQTFVSVPLVSTDTELAAILKQAKEGGDWFARLNRPEQGVVYSVDDLRAAANDAHLAEVSNGLWMALGFAAAGACWLGLWWVIGWIVRGFLA